MNEGTRSFAVSSSSGRSLKSLAGLDLDVETMADLASGQAAIRRVVCRRCRRCDWDDVATDAITGLWQYVKAGKPVRSLSGLAVALVQSAVSRMRRQSSGVSYCDLDTFADLPGTRANGPAPLSELSLAFSVGDLRGSRERWLCQRVLEGWSAVEMADALGRPLAQVRHQLLTLAAKLTERRRGERA